jgi:16S rRNA (guanine527-N7)-methyltransferase
LSTLETPEFTEYIRYYLKKSDINVSDESLNYLKYYFDRLLEKKDQYNLVGKLTGKGIMDKLFLDSLLGLKILSIKDGCTLLDVGTGAGFPGLVLKIARPEINLSLLDASGKKISFVKSVSNDLGIENVEFLQNRAEIMGRDIRYRDSFDIVTSKAFAPMNQLLEFSDPFIKKGGKLYAWKGIHYRKEMEEISECYALLNLSKPEFFEYCIPEETNVTVIVIFEKADKTPELFPRSYQAIKRKPISRDFCKSTKNLPDNNV